MTLFGRDSLVNSMPANKERNIMERKCKCGRTTILDCGLCPSCAGDKYSTERHSYELPHIDYSPNHKTLEEKT